MFTDTESKPFDFLTSGSGSDSLINCPRSLTRPNVIFLKREGRMEPHSSQENFSTGKVTHQENKRDQYYTDPCQKIWHFTSYHHFHLKLKHWGKKNLPSCISEQKSLYLKLFQELEVGNYLCDSILSAGSASKCSTEL